MQLLLAPAALWAAAACLAAGAAADARNATCPGGLPQEECLAAKQAAAATPEEAVGFPLNLVWPPSRATLPQLVALALGVWTIVATTLVNKETTAERDYQIKRAQQVLSQVAQTVYEHKQNTEKWEKYQGRKKANRELAAERFQQMKKDNPNLKESEESVFQMVVIETGFASETPPEAALAPKRVFQVLIDEVDDCHVTKIPLIKERLGPKSYEELEGYFTEVHRILMERVNDKLSSVLSKTEKGFRNNQDPRYVTYASGIKLADLIDLAKKIKKQFYPGRLLGLKDPQVTETEAVTFLKLLKDAKTLMREIKRTQSNRVTQLIGFFEPRTFAYMALAASTRVFGGAIGPMRTTLFNKVVTHATLPDWQERVYYDLGCICVVFFLDWYVNDWLSMTCTSKATSLLKHSMRTQLFEAVMRQDTEYFEEHDGSAIQDRVKHDCDHVAERVLYIPMDIIGILASMAFHLYLMYSFCPGMLPRTMGIACLIAPCFIGMNRLVDAVRRRDDRTIRAMRTKTDEMLQKVKAVREFSREKQEAGELDRGERTLARSMLLCDLVNHTQYMVIFTLFMAAEMSNYWYGARLVNENLLDSVALIQIGGLVNHITWMMRHLIEQVPRFLRLMIPVERIFELLESKSLIEPMPGDERAPFTAKSGGVELVFKDVTFAYPMMPEVTVLRGLSLRIPPGKTVAICGERGAGKSTIFALMQRQYDVEYGKGEVILNDRPISYWDVRQYRRAIAVIAQKGLLFKGTIKENILYGLNDAEIQSRSFHLPEGDEELQRLCEITGMWDIVKEFPLKIETRIGTGGVTLSGGTEQCLCIGRALVKHPALLLMDEATSAMDTHTQKKAAAGIAAEQKRLGFSIVQVAHRIETLTRSDVLFFVEQGKVVEVGGESSLNGSAVEELRDCEIKYAEVRNPETGKMESTLVSGFFRQLWEAYYELDFHSMSLVELNKKVRMLTKQLEKATAEKEAKLGHLVGRLPAIPPEIYPLKMSRHYSANAAPCSVNPKDAMMAHGPDSPTPPPELTMHRFATQYDRPAVP